MKLIIVNAHSRRGGRVRRHSRMGMSPQLPPHMKRKPALHKSRAAADVASAKRSVKKRRAVGLSDSELMRRVPGSLSSADRKRQQEVVNRLSNNRGGTVKGRKRPKHMKPQPYRS